MSAIFSNVFSKISGFFGTFTGDAIFIIVTFLAFFGLTMLFGKERIVSFVLAFYPTNILFNTFPFMSKIIILKGDKLIALNKIIVFVLILWLVNIIINRFIFASGEGSFTPSILHNAELTLGATILLLIFSYGTVSLDPFHNFGGGVDALFTGTDKLFYWNLAPLALLFLI